MKDVPVEKIAELLSYDPDTGLFVRKRYIVGGESAADNRPPASPQHADECPG